MTKMFPRMPEKTKSPNKIASTVRTSDMASSSAWRHTLLFLCDASHVPVPLLLLFMLLYIYIDADKQIDLSHRRFIFADQAQGQFNLIC